jgi:maltokinase
VVPFADERWFADRGRVALGVEHVDVLGELELVRVVFEEGEPSLYSLVPDTPDWNALFARAGGSAAFAAEGGVPEAAAEPLAVDQSHSSWRVGDSLVKCYRRLVVGVHPEVELATALGAVVPEHVAPVRGSLHWRTAGGEPVALAVVQEFVPDADEGWEWAAARAASDDVAWVRDVGAVARRVHDALARVFPTRAAGAADRRAWRVAAEAQLDDALALAGDDLSAAAPRIRHELARLQGDAPATMTRIHGDLHVGQFLHGPGGRVVLVDFEGQPGKPTRELDSPMRDLAALARSLDHCGRYAVEAHGAEAERVEPWIAAARDALFAGYGPHDDALRSAFEWERAVYEFMYAARYLPDWLYAPRGGLRALLAA